MESCSPVYLIDFQPCVLTLCACHLHWYWKVNRTQFTSHIYGAQAHDSIIKMHKLVLLVMVVFLFRISCLPGCWPLDLVSTTTFFHTKNLLKDSHLYQAINFSQKDWKCNLDTKFPNLRFNHWYSWILSSYMSNNNKK